MLRFWSKVNKDTDSGCWEWIASLSRDGYGNFRFESEMTLAHRVSWILSFGKIKKGLYVLHRCDNPKCVNPKHLFLGTQDDNMADMRKKGREFKAWGEGSGLSKMTELKVCALRKEYKEKVPVRLLAKKYHLDRSTVYRIASGLTWSRV